MKKLLSALFVLALFSTAAMANIPWAANCTVLPADNFGGLVIAPDSPSPIAATINTITVRNQDNVPIANSPVVITMGAAIRRCTTAVHQGTTNANGQVVITLRGGGCLHNIGSAGVVTASGITIREYNHVKSPDWNGAAPDGQVTLADLINFNTGASCHDYNNDGVVNLSDLIVFSAAYVPTHTCTLQ